MKRFASLFISTIMVFGIFSMLFAGENEIPAKAKTVLPEKHFILNADGSYGGSLNEQLYGKGAPKNGEYDIENSEYYTINDFYNMKSTNEDYPLTLFPNFKPYQQTMEKSSAFACMVMALNVVGKDIAGDYSELSLLQKYEEFKGVSVKENDVDARSLRDFITYLDEGLTLGEVFGNGIEKGQEAGVTYSIAENLKEGNLMLVRYTSEADYGWKLIIGLDQMGTEDGLDDTIIFANPFDVSDHYQDGYSTARLSNFIAWWFNINEKFERSGENEIVVIKAGYTPNFLREERDTTEKQPHFELHHILNADGSYGGTRDKSKYGSISTKNGDRNVAFSNYYKINDYYNMKDKGSRLLLEKYNTYQQTMSASCGICSMMSVIKYYGKYVDESWEVKLCEEYELIAHDSVYPSGTKDEYNAEVLAKYGLKAVATHTKKGDENVTFPTYESYRDFIKENLEKDRPIMISIRNRGGHWVTIIGIDDMGTSNVYDDVIITSDSSDYWDHYQDGYATYSATGLYSNHYTSKLDVAYSMVYFENSPTPIGLIVGVIAGVVVLSGVIVFVIVKSKKVKVNK